MPLRFFLGWRLWDRLLFNPAHCFLRASADSIPSLFSSPLFPRNATGDASPFKGDDSPRTSFRFVAYVVGLQFIFPISSTSNRPPSELFSLVRRGGLCRYGCALHILLPRGVISLWESVSRFHNHPSPVRVSAGNLVPPFERDLIVSFFPCHDAVGFFFTDFLPW